MIRFGPQTCYFRAGVEIWSLRVSRGNSHITLGICQWFSYTYELAGHFYLPRESSMIFQHCQETHLAKSQTFKGLKGQPHKGFFLDQHRISGTIKTLNN